ncbi:MAG: RNA polymerase sigma factor [Planctomycetota bacterium]
MDAPEQGPLQDPVDVTAEIVARIQDGDQAAWNDLYARYHDQLLLAVRCRLGAKLRAHLQSEDVLQSVLLEALDELPRFESRGKGSLRHFLNVLITNKIRDRADTYNAQKRRGGVALTDSILAAVPGFDGNVAYRDAESYEELERCLEQLPENMRQIIVLRRIEGLSSKEAAAELDTSDAAARKLYSRAMARLIAAMS